MNGIINSIFTQIPEDATIKTIVLFILLALFLYSLAQANAIYDFFERFNKRELAELRDLLADENISETAKKKLRERIDLIAYKRVTRIKTNKYLQKKIINCYELAGGRLRYSDFKRAFNFIKIDESGNLVIRKPKKIEFILIIASTIASILVLAAFLLLLYVFIFAAMPIQNRITIFLLAIFCFLSSLIYFYPLSSVFVANRIKKEINIYNSKNKHLRPYGLCEGEFTVPDDFDDPLPEDILKTFEGK